MFYIELQNKYKELQTAVNRLVSLRLQYIEANADNIQTIKQSISSQISALEQAKKKYEDDMPFIMKAGVNFIGISVGFFCHDGNGKILLHKRSINTRDEHGHWDCGGGRLEHGETPEQGVLRELKEEYGCSGVIEHVFHPLSIHRQWDGKQTHWITFPYIIRINPNDAIITEPEAIDELGWFTLDALPDPLHSGFEKTFKTYENEFKKFINKS